MGKRAFREGFRLITTLLIANFEIVIVGGPIFALFKRSFFQKNEKGGLFFFDLLHLPYFYAEEASRELKTRLKRRGCALSAHSCHMSLVKRFQKSTYGKPDRFYESKAWDPSIWHNYWVILVFDDRYDHLRDSEEEILELKRELFKETWEGMMRQKAGKGYPENVAEAL